MAIIIVKCPVELESKDKIKCIRTSCDEGIPWEKSKREIVELGFRVNVNNNVEWLHLEGGPTGYESAQLEDLKRWAFSLKTRLGFKPQVWEACWGTKTVSWPEEPPSEENCGMGQEAGFKFGWDRLEVPASEIRRLFKERRKTDK